MRFIIVLLLATSVACFGQDDSKKGTVKVSKVVSDTTIFTTVDTMPQFSGGNAAMYKFVQSNLRYPRSAVERGSSGTCFITFAVNTDGSLSNVSILKGVNGCSECDLEALRVIKLMPNWVPGINKGMVVRVQFNLPINFRLQ